MSDEPVEVERMMFRLSRMRERVIDSIEARKRGPLFDASIRHVLAYEGVHREITDKTGGGSR